MNDTKIGEHFTEVRVDISEMMDIKRCEMLRKMIIVCEL